jgi:AcrR family transcriptional regulator
MPKLGMEAIRRRQVIDAVVKILETQGWKDLTIREVSEVAGVSAGILTHYFGNKRSMTIDSIAEAHSRTEKSLMEIERRRLPPAVAMRAIIDFLSQPAPPPVPDARFWLAIAGRMPFDKMIQAEMQKLHQRALEFICHVIAEGTAQGVFAPIAPPGDVADRLLAMATGFNLAGVRDPAGLPPARRHALLLEAARHELAADLSPPAGAAGQIEEATKRRGR